MVRRYVLRTANRQQTCGSIRDGVFTPDDTPISGVTLELREGNTGLAIDGSQLLPGIYPAGPVRTTTDANGFYEFTGLRSGGSYAVFEIQPDGYFDGIDTPGSPQSLAFNEGDLTQAGDLSQLSEPHRNDAIIRIAVTVTSAARNNNFSEVLVESDPPVLIPHLCRRNRLLVYHQVRFRHWLEQFHQPSE